MPIMKGDIGPAITELRKAYMEILKYLDKYEADHWSKPNSQYRTKMPVLGVAPKGRRKETGWYKPSSWESQATSGFAKLGAAPASAALHGEVFLAGEILDKPKEDIVKVLIHQAIHQIAAEPSTTSYHSAMFAEKAKRYGIQPSTKEGWGYSEFYYPKHWRDFIAQVAQGIDSASLNVHRRPEDEIAVGTGKMRLWVCKCNKPKLRTGGILRGTCDMCGHPFMYADKSRLCSLKKEDCPQGLDPSVQAHWDSDFYSKFGRAVSRYSTSTVPVARRLMNVTGTGCNDSTCVVCHP